MKFGFGKKSVQRDPETPHDEPNDRAPDQPPELPSDTPPAPPPGTPRETHAQESAPGERITRPITISTSDPCVKIRERFAGLHEFIERNPKLVPLAEDLFDRLSEAVPSLYLGTKPGKHGGAPRELDKADRDYPWRCLLYLRSSFSTDLHPLYVAMPYTPRDEDNDPGDPPRDDPPAPPSAEDLESDPYYKVARQNWFSGLHPLPQVLDALYGRMEKELRHHVRVDLDFTAKDHNRMRMIPILTPPQSVLAGHRAEDKHKTYLETRHIMLRVSRNAREETFDRERHDCGQDATRRDGSDPNQDDPSVVFRELMFENTLRGIDDESECQGTPDGTYPCIRDFEIWNKLFSDNTPMNTALIAGASGLCAALRVRANLMMYRAVMGGVFSLWRYGSPKYARNDQDDVITTILCRPGNAAAVSAGVILFGRGPRPRDDGSWDSNYGPTRDEEAIARISDTLQKWTWEVEDVIRDGIRMRSWNPKENMAQDPVPSVSDEPSAESVNPREERVALLGKDAHEALKRLLDINPGQPNMRYCSTQIGEAIADSAGMRLSAQHRRGLGHAICRLLERAILLSDTHDEGRPVSFGLMLGDPFNVRYWPGARPSPIVEPIGPNNKQHSLSIDRLRSRMEYVAGPQLRCVVFPYFAVYPRGGRGDNNPSYVIDLAEFGPSIASWPPSTLWSHESSTYAYLSAQCPGTIACLVGPGAHVRVFANGNMVAYRNSREWFVLQDVASVIPDEPVGGVHLRQVARQLLELGAAMSPFHNPERHGGFIAWTRHSHYDENGRPIDPESLKKKDRDAREKLQHPPGARLECLHSGEPERLFAKCPWLSGRELLKWEYKPPREDDNKDREKRLVLDFPVAQQVLKASERDGAIWLTGERCRFRNFGMRVSMDSHFQGHGGNIGTKRRTAEDLVAAGHGETLAVTISSDGPIRLLYLPQGSHDVVSGEMFSAAETNERDYH